LNTLFTPNPSPIPLSNLASLAEKVYLRYMTSNAHYDALGDVPRPVGTYGQPGTPMKSVDEGVEKHGWNGDRQMANLTLRMRDCLWYYELCHAIVDGDIGRVMEIIKVIAVFLWIQTYLLLKSLAFAIFILGCWST
jgi:hypothetical protein